VREVTDILREAQVDRRAGRHDVCIGPKGSSGVPEIGGICCSPALSFGCAGVVEVLRVAAYGRPIADFSLILEDGLPRFRNSPCDGEIEPFVELILREVLGKGFGQRQRTTESSCCERKSEDRSLHVEGMSVREFVADVVGPSFSPGSRFIYIYIYKTHLSK
jgi:hypothetical protein